MTLGELIEALAREEPSRIVPVGFNEPHSYRGDYSEIAFTPTVNVTVGEMLAAARGALGETFQGYKGGDFTMDRHTPCWLSYWGDASEEAIGPVLLSYMLGNPQLPISRWAQQVAR